MSDLGISVGVPVFCNVDNSKVVSAVENALKANFPTAQVQVSLSDDISYTAVSEAGGVILDRVDSIVGDAMDSCIV